MILYWWEKLKVLIKFMGMDKNLNIDVLMLKFLVVRKDIFEVEFFFFEFFINSEV